MRQVDFMEVNCHNFDIIRISTYLSLSDILRIFVSYYASFEFSKTCCNCETYCFSKKNLVDYYMGTNPYQNSLSVRLKVIEKKINK